MRTSYGLEFNTVTEINPEWSDYDKTIAECHLANTGADLLKTYKLELAESNINKQLFNSLISPTFFTKHESFV